MDRKEKIKHLKWLEKYVKRNEKLTDSLIKHGYSIESNAVTELGFQSTSVINMVSKLVGDNHEWVEWHIYENDFGKKKFEAGFDGKLKKITNWDMLLDIVEYK